MELLNVEGDVEMMDAVSAPESEELVFSDTSNLSSASSIEHESSFDIDDDLWDDYVADTGRIFLFQPGYGWEERLEAEGFSEINLTGPSQGDLSNEIHPLFGPERFLLEDFLTNTNSSLWRDLEPTMRLASRMLLSAPVMAFLRKVKFGHEVDDPTTGRRYLVEDSPKPIKEANAEVLQDLGKLAQKLIFVFAAIAPSPDADSQCHAIHYVSQKDFGHRVFIRRRAGRLPPDTGKYHYIALNQAYRDYFTSSSARTPCRDMRTRFLLAGTLLHEIVGHAFYARDRTDGYEDYVEPYFDRDQADADPELGCALDHMLFGSQVSSIVDPVLGGYLEHWPVLCARKGKSLVTSKTHVIFPVSSSWIYSWFRDSFWDRLDKLPLELQLTAFHFPKSNWAAVRPNVKVRKFTWKPRRELLPKGSRIKPVEAYEEINHVSLQEALDDVCCRTQI